MQSSYVLVHTTVPTDQQATDLAHSLVATGLAACVQMQTIRSVCRWKGELCAGPEILLSIKTTGQQYPLVEQHIKANHPYETPEIIQLPITTGSAEYLGWIDACVGVPHA